MHGEEDLREGEEKTEKEGTVKKTKARRRKGKTRDNL